MEINVEELKQMTFEEILEKKEELPHWIDVSTLDESNFDDFKLWLELLDEDIKFDEEITSIEKSASAKNYFVAAYGSFPFLILAHEGLHAVGGILTGARIESIGMDNVGFYVEMSGEKFSEAVSSLLPDFILPIFGFYYMRRGVKERNLHYLGFGASATLLNVGSLFLGYGDFANVSKFLAPLVGIGTYILSYKVADLIYKLHGSKSFKS